MARQARLRAAGIPFHVIQRGHNRSPCFFTDLDREYYLQELRRQAADRGVAVHAYVLMSNHVHLLMTSADADGIPDAMKLLGQRYVQYVNRCRRRSGTLWEGRYRSCLVDSERYLLVCHRYIELNPVRARMVDQPADYRWSSYRANALGEPDPLITLHPVVEVLGSDPPDRRRAYREMFDEALTPELVEQVRVCTNGGFALGSAAFQQDMARLLRRRVTPASRGGARRRSMGSVPIEESNGVCPH